MSAPSLRSRVRAEMIDEIKAVARRHLAADGANLSLRAVARDLGMVSSALYRYFASRDELLTALILDAYIALGAAVEAGDASVDRGDLRGRWLAATRAARRWAAANPSEYALIYGSPVPGYAAPRTTVEPAGRPPAVLLGIIRDGVLAGRLTEDPATVPPEPVHGEITAIAAALAPEVPPGLLVGALTGWVQVFGLISFDLFGRLNNGILDREAFFDHQMSVIADLIGLPQS